MPKLLSGSLQDLMTEDSEIKISRVLIIYDERVNYLFAQFGERELAHGALCPRDM